MSAVTIHEVGPRDGLQNEAVIVPTQSKVRLVEALARSGLRRIEVTSFVSPKWIPQLADASELLAQLDVAAAAASVKRPPPVISALCPNATGLKRARRAGLEHVALFMSVSDTHNRKNLGRARDETLASYRKLRRDGLLDDLRVRGYLSTVVACPYEGAVSPDAVLEQLEALRELGCEQISLGDTIGAAVPTDIRRLLQTLATAGTLDDIALHLHDTRGTALANALTGFDLGISTFDASIAGMGGCPYAPGAAGNLATEDIVWTLERMGVDTGVDLETLWQAGQVAAQVIGRPLPGKVHRAGLRLSAY